MEKFGQIERAVHTNETIQLAISASQEWKELNAALSLLGDQKIGTAQKNVDTIISDIDLARKAASTWDSEIFDSLNINDDWARDFTRDLGLRKKVFELIVKERKDINDGLLKTIMQKTGSPYKNQILRALDAYRNGERI
jgi:hypothetical protein